MKNLYEFIQRIIADLRLGNIGPTMQKTLELKIGEIVDEQIEGALVSTLTEADWQIYETYKVEHPDSPPEEAFDAMLGHRPEIQKTIEDTLMNTYEDMMIRGEAVEEEMEQ